MKRLIFISSTILFMSCGSSQSTTSSSSSSTYDTSTAIVIASAVSGTASTSDDSGGSPTASRMKPDLYRSLASLLLPEARAATCASAAKVRGQACSTDVMSLSLGGCTGLLGATWTGNYTLTFDSTTSCANAAGGSGGSDVGGILGADGMNYNGNTGNVTFTSTSGVTRTAISGAYVTTSSNSSGFNSTVSGGLEIACNSSDCEASPGRAVTVNGIHRQQYDALGTIIYDHSYNTSTAFAITGSGASKEISAGTIVLQHNLAQFVATSAVATPLTFMSGCCFPVGGTMTTTFSSGKTGTETLTFGPTCGTASVNGNTIALTHCM